MKRLGGLLWVLVVAFWRPTTLVAQSVTAGGAAANEKQHEKNARFLRRADSATFTSTDANADSPRLLAHLKGIFGVRSDTISSEPTRLLSFAEDLDAAFGLGTAWSIVLFIVLLTTALLIVIGAFAFIVHKLAARRGTELSDKDEAAAAMLFYDTAVAREQSATANSVEDDDAQSDSSGSSTVTAMGARAYCMTDHDRQLQQMAASDTVTLQALGRKGVCKLLRMIEALVEDGVEIRPIEDSGMQLIAFAGVRRSDASQSSPRDTVDHSRRSSKAGAASTAAALSKPSGPTLMESVWQPQSTLFKGKTLYHCQSVMSNRQIPSQELSFLEIHVRDLPIASELAIGVSPRFYPCYRLPGWHSGSLAYHSADGSLFREDSVVGTEGGHSYGVGDFIGLLTKRSSNGAATECLFYRNGQLQAFACIPKEWSDELHVCIGARGPAAVITNFGTTRCRYPPFVDTKIRNLPFGEAPSLSNSARRRLSPVGTPTVSLPVSAYALAVTSASVEDATAYLETPSTYPRGFVGRMGVTTGDFTPIAHGNGVDNASLVLTQTHEGPAGQSKAAALGKQQNFSTVDEMDPWQRRGGRSSECSTALSSSFMMTPDASGSLDGSNLDGAHDTRRPSGGVMMSGSAAAHMAAPLDGGINHDDSPASSELDGPKMPSLRSLMSEGCSSVSMSPQRQRGPSGSGYYPDEDFNEQS